MSSGLELGVYNFCMDVAPGAWVVRPGKLEAQAGM